METNLPTRLRALHQSGVIETSLGQYEKVNAELTEALRLNPDDVVNYANVARNYISVNRLDEAKATLDGAQARKLESEFLLQTFYILAFRRDDAREMERVLSVAAGKPGTEDVILSAQSDTEAFHGRLGKAREFSKRAIDSALHNDARETASFWQCNAALRESEFGNAGPAKQQATTALGMAHGGYEQAVAALALARAGEAVRAQAMAEDLGKRFPTDTLLNGYWLPSVRGAIELSRSNAARSIEILRAAAPYELGQIQPFAVIGIMYPTYLRGLAYLATRNGMAAAAEFQKIIDHPGIVLNFPLGALAHLQLGRAYALSGNTAKAKGAYQDFFALWKDADPDIPILKQAKAEYAKLQ